MKNQLKFSLLSMVALCFGMSVAQAQSNPRYNRPAPPNGGLYMERVQKGGDRMEKLESAKIAFITQRVDLSPREAEKFWPVYNQFQAEMRVLLKERFSSSGAELPANERIDKQLDVESKIVELKKRYTREFSKVIPADKIVRLFQAEKDFKTELIRELQERKERRH